MFTFEIIFKCIFICNNFFFFSPHFSPNIFTTFIYIDPRLTYYFLFHLYVAYARRVTKQLSQHLPFGLMESGCTLLESISTLYFHSSIYCSLRSYYLGLEKNKFQLAL